MFKNMSDNDKFLYQHKLVIGEIASSRRYNFFSLDDNNSIDINRQMYNVFLNSHNLVAVDKDKDDTPILKKARILGGGDSYINDFYKPTKEGLLFNTDMLLTHKRDNKTQKLECIIDKYPPLFALVPKQYHTDHMIYTALSFSPKCLYFVDNNRINQLHFEIILTTYPYYYVLEDMAKHFNIYNYIDTRYKKAIEKELNRYKLLIK